MAAKGLVISTVQGVAVAEIHTTSLLEGPEVENIAQDLLDLVDKRGFDKVIVDFRNVSFLASVMLGKLVMLYKKAKEVDATVVLSGLKPNLLKVFKVTKLDKMMKFSENEDEALRHFGFTAAG
jgi:anti-sigma B factor antagonist